MQPGKGESINQKGSEETLVWGGGNDTHQTVTVNHVISEK